MSGRPSPNVQRAADAANTRLDERIITTAIGTPASGTISAPQLRGDGTVSTYTVQQDGGGPTLYGVRPSGRSGEGVGARVNLLGRGGLLGTTYDIVEVTEAYPGYSGGDHQQFLSTPVIAQITSEREVADDGTIGIIAYVTIYCIQEHYNNRIPTLYEIQVRDAEAPGTPDANPTNASPLLERIAGQLKEELGAGDDTFAIEVVDTPNPPTFDFLRANIIVGIDDELIFVPSVQPVTETEVLLEDGTRGYAGTDDEEHDEGADVVLRGITIPSNALFPNRAYFVRARARAGMRRSNWTDWVGLLTTYDTTPPGWSGGPITPTVTSNNTGMVVTWDEADEDYNDLLRYWLEVGNASDFSGGSEILPLGNGNTWTYSAPPGIVKWFRVRAEDTSNNLSNWSNGARGYTTLPDEPQGTNLAPNPTAASNVSNWTHTSGYTTGGAASLTRDTSIYFDAAGSFRISQTRQGGLDTPVTHLSDAFSVVGGREYYLRLWLRNSAFTSADYIGVVVYHKTGSGGGFVNTTALGLTGAQLPSGLWTPVVVPVFFAANITYAQILLNLKVGAGSGTVLLHLDDVYFVQATDDFSGDTVGIGLRPVSRPSATRLMASNGATMFRVLTGSATLNFGSIAAHTTAELTIAVPGAVAGNWCGVSPDGAPESGLLWSGYVSATDTVTVRMLNGTAGSINPASRDWVAEVHQYGFG
jgi:hypothetical protein